MHFCYAKTFVTLFLISLVGCSFGSKFVPFLLWTNTKGAECQQKSQEISEQRLSQVLDDEYMNCLSAINPDRVVMFVYDKLSVEDITIYGKASTTTHNAFMNIEKNLKESPTSLFAQSVEPTNIVEDIALKMKQYFPETEIDEVLIPKIDRSTQESTFTELAIKDSEIERKLKEITGSYIAIVTSEGSNDKYEKVEKAPKRQLLQTVVADQNATHIKGECIYMYYTQLSFVKGASWYVLNIDDDSSPVETCSNTTGIHTLSLMFTSSPNDLADVNVTFVFMDKWYPVSGRRWWNLDQVTLTSTNFSTPYQFNPRFFNETVSAPDEWSYVCAKPANLTYVKKNSKGIVVDSAELEFKNWQLQPFNVTNGEFSRASDCSGWFTGPIWTGLLVSLLLIFILSYGIVMLGYVTTMDRFDDPKKKTISVPQEN